MALHGFGRRSPDDATDSTLSTSIISGSIGTDQATASLDGTIVSASDSSALTTYTTSITVLLPATGTGVPQETVIATAVTVRDSASLAALTATSASSASSSTSQDASATTSSAAASSTSATSSSSSSSSSNLSTLIPAIVAPIAAILLISFALFWFYMRRRHLREMEGSLAAKGEKIASRSTSNGSAKSIDRPVVKVAAAVAPSSEYPPPAAQPEATIPLEEIGVARPLTSRDSGSPVVKPQSPDLQYNQQKGQGQNRPQYPNFSGPWPNTARSGPPSRPGPPPSTPNQGFGPRRPPPPAVFGPQPYRPRKPPGPPRPPRSPRMGPPGPSPTSGVVSRALPGHPRAAPAPPGPPANRLRGPAPAMGASVASSKRAPPPRALSPPPTGAYNGGSSISQYSPIIKQTPNIASALGSHAPTKTKDGPARTLAPIITTSTRDVPRSPMSSDAGLTDENLHIARLGSSSTLGYLVNTPDSPSDVSSAAAAAANNTSPREASASDGQNMSSPGTASTSYPSPKLPPPATLSQLIPSHSPLEERQVDYFGSPNTPVSASSLYASTITGALPNFSTTFPYRGSRRRENPRSDGGSYMTELDNYEDIEAKSDISSLSEFHTH